MLGKHHHKVIVLVLLGTWALIQYHKQVQSSEDIKWWPSPWGPDDQRGRL